MDERKEHPVHTPVYKPDAAGRLRDVSFEELKLKETGHDFAFDASNPYRFDVIHDPFPKSTGSEESVAVPPDPPLDPPEPTVLPSLADFPGYYQLHRKAEIAATMDKANYVVSLGGPPLADLKYGVIIVPAGTEEKLFRKPGHVIDQDFLDVVRDANEDYEKALRTYGAKDITRGFVHRQIKDFPPELKINPFDNMLIRNGDGRTSKVPKAPERPGTEYHTYP